MPNPLRNRRRPLAALAAVFAGLAGCGGQPETVDDATVTNPPAAKATAENAPAPAEAKPGG